MSTQGRSAAASDVYKRQTADGATATRDEATNSVPSASEPRRMTRDLMMTNLCVRAKCRHCRRWPAPLSPLARDDRPTGRGDGQGRGGRRGAWRAGCSGGGSGYAPTWRGRGVAHSGAAALAGRHRRSAAVGGTRGIATSAGKSPTDHVSSKRAPAPSTSMASAGVTTTTATTARSSTALRSKRSTASASCR